MNNKNKNKLQVNVYFRNLHKIETGKLNKEYVTGCINIQFYACYLVG